MGRRRSKPTEAERADFWDLVEALALIRPDLRPHIPRRYR